MINKRFLFFSTAAAFESAKSEIQSTSIAFVDQPAVAQVGEVGDQDYAAAIPAQRFVYTHGKKFETNFDPASIEAALDALDGRLDIIEGDNTTSGSIAKAVKDLGDSIDAILGTGFDTTNTVASKISANASAIETLNGNDSTAGSVAKSIKDALDALDFTIASANHANGRAIVSVTQTNGAVSATEGNIDSQYVTYTPQVTSEQGAAETTYDTTNTNVQSVLAEIFSKIAANEAAGEFEVYQGSIAAGNKVNTIAADGQDYIFAQGGVAVATMNIAKDLFLKSGEVVYGTYDSSTHTFTPGTAAADQSNAYIKLVINNGDDDATDSIIYIPAAALVTEYSANNASGAKVTINVSNHQISAAVTAGSIEKTDLVTSLQNEITSARTAIVEKSTGHITVTKTAGTGATPDSYTVAEDDIASAALVGEIPSGATATTVVGYAAEVAENAADDAIDEITGDASDALPSKLTLNSLKNAVDTLNGNDSTSGSVAKAKKDAIDTAKGYADDITVNGNSQVNQNITIEAGDIDVESGYAKAATAADVVAGDTISEALGKIEKKIDSLDSDLTNEIRWEQGTKNSSAVSGAVQTKGSNSKAYGVNSVAAGTAVTANNEGEAAFGLYNASATGETDAAKTVFSVGIGASAVAPKNAIEVRKDGTINIYKSVSDVSATSLQSILAELDWYEA